ACCRGQSAQTARYPWSCPPAPDIDAAPPPEQPPKRLRCCPDLHVGLYLRRIRDLSPKPSPTRRGARRSAMQVFPLPSQMLSTNGKNRFRGARREGWGVCMRGFSSPPPGPVEGGACFYRQPPQGREAVGGRRDI